jgi:hypothetical protein
MKTESMRVSTKVTTKVELDPRPTVVVPTADKNFAGWGPRLRY